MNEIRDFEEFIEYYKLEALQIDLSKREWNAYNIMETQKTKLSDIKFDSQLDEVIKFSEKAVAGSTDFLIQVFNNKSYLRPYTNNNAPFLNHIKAYFEYTELYNKAIELKEQKTITDVEIPTFDLSDSTATEKIIYLQKLGVIDFLRNNNYISINGLATVLSAITGEKPLTIQSMLNPIISKEAGQKNNPLNSNKTVQKVEQQLIKIGFKLK